MTPSALRDIDWFDSFGDVSRQFELDSRTRKPLAAVLKLLRLVFSHRYAARLKRLDEARQHRTQFLAEAHREVGGSVAIDADKLLFHAFSSKVRTDALVFVNVFVTFTSTCCCCCCGCVGIGSS